ncbi:type II toxin-antitoxin system RelE/ParE family toxin [Morganella morganii]|uniref:type II toxin-antitoxin system RelE/ParE family toxin n=1 Tax=Morganella morganii TaxID=582 RepID=UPI0030B9E219
MKVYKTNIFSKKNIKNMGLSDSTLMKIALDVMSGVYEANLGGGVIKKRLALPGRGKRSGARTIIFFKAGQNLFLQMVGRKQVCVQKVLLKSGMMNLSLIKIWQKTCCH